MSGAHVVVEPAWNQARKQVAEEPSEPSYLSLLPASAVGEWAGRREDAFIGATHFEDVEE
ncbi:hypothetical protein [Streptomyces sp. NPDC058695]|uniref:hypothetical protein n=1 Tax=Streptomyces sp. NPDC058695 TaxID=3346604 RepID=UPI003653B6B9